MELRPITIKAAMRVVDEFLSQVERGEKGCSQWLLTAYENLKAARDAPTAR